MTYTAAQSGVITATSVRPPGAGNWVLTVTGSGGTATGALTTTVLSDYKTKTLAESNLIGYWSFDSAANFDPDSFDVVQGIPAACTATATVIPVSTGGARPGTGFGYASFTSGTPHIGTISNGTPFGSSFSIETWVRGPFACSTAVADNLCGIVSFSNASNYAVQVGCQEAGGRCTLEFKTTAGGVSRVVTDTAQLSNGVWHQVVAVRDGTAFTLYVDGAQAITSPTGSNPTTITTSASASYFGHSQLANESGFFSTGDMDETSVYLRALSASEVACRYRLAKGNPALAASVCP